METQQNQIVSRKKTFWKMMKTIFLPAQTLANLMVGCGGGKKGKVKRRLSIKNMHLAKEAFLRSSFRRQTSRRSVATSGSSVQRSQSQGIHTDNSREAGNSSNTTTNTDIMTGTPNESLPLPLQPTSILNAITELAAPDESTTTATALPAPLNLEEAEFLLESLTLCGNGETQASSNDYFTAVAGVGGRDEPLVEVEVEVEISRDDIPSSPSSSSDRDSFHYENDDDSINSNNNITVSNRPSIADPPQEVVLRRTQKLSTSSDAGSEFHGWRRSSIEVTSNPPVTLAYIPSGLCVGDRIVWVKDDIPEIGTVRWIGKIRNQFYTGIEFDKPIGNSSGLYGYGTGLYKQLFSCKLSYGRFVPVKELVLYKDYHDTGIKSGIVCVICRDDFLDTWEPDLFVQSTSTTPTSTGDDDQHGLQPFHMVSTKCGHLYHWGCLDEWFSTKKRIEYHCPFCVRSMERDEVIRIFPTQI